MSYIRLPASILNYSNNDGVYLVETCYIISFLGDDRPGLVKQVAQVVAENQGNWLDSQLSQLGGKFAGLILISLPSASGEDLEIALKELSHSGFRVQVTPTTMSMHFITSQFMSMSRVISLAMTSRISENSSRSVCCEI